MKNDLANGLPAPVIEYITKLEKRVEHLTEALLAAQKARFGKSSEKKKYLMPDGLIQETLFNEAETYADETEPEPVLTTVEKHTRKAKRTKEELAKELPVKEIMINLPENERICGICEGGLQAIGKELIRRELNIIPAEAYVSETYRINYSCNGCLKETDEANIVKPEVPVPVIKRGLASPSSAAYVMYQKYVNAMPLYRQSEDWKRFGVTVTRATLANWIIYTSLHWLLPLWEAWKRILVKSAVIMADETVVQVLKEPGKTPQSESRMWVYCTGDTGGPPISLFEYQPNRGGENPKRFLADAKDFYLTTDGYAGYNAVTNAIHTGCFAHMRRKFTDALPKKTERQGNTAAKGIEFCDKLFLLEREFKNLSYEERYKKRIEKSKPVLDDFYKWINTLDPLGGSKLGTAVVYAHNQKAPLSAFLLDGRIEISTNRIENQIRPFAVGRKNYLFCDTVAGAKASAVAYSVVETARANGLNPYKYLVYLFTELPTVLTKNPDADLSPFFPWNVAVQDKCRVQSGSCDTVGRVAGL